MTLIRRSRLPKEPTTSTTSTLHNDSICTADTLRRRRSAAERLPSLDCGCADPWPCRCTEPPLTAHALDAWVATAEVILGNGKTPLLPLEVLRALHRRGGTDRALAERLHAASGGAVA